MKNGFVFCDQHRRKMADAIHELGLWHLVSANEAHLRARIAANDPFDVDPLYMLFASMTKLSSAVLDRNLVPHSLVQCPMCYFREEAQRSEWIENAAIAIASLIKRREVERQRDIERVEELHRQSTSG